MPDTPKSNAKPMRKHRAGLATRLREIQAGLAELHPLSAKVDRLTPSSGRRWHDPPFHTSGGGIMKKFTARPRPRGQRIFATSAKSPICNRKS